MEIQLVYGIQIRIWPSIWKEKKTIIRIILVVTTKKQIRRPTEGESALHQNTPQYCIH